MLYVPGHAGARIPAAAMTAPPSAPARAAPLAAYVIAALPPLFWSGNFLVARIMHDAIPPIQMSFWRWVGAFCILAPIAARQWGAHRAQIRAELPFLAVLGLVGITAFNCFIYAALHFTTVVNAALINSLMPVATFLFALVLLRDKLTARQMAGVAVAIAGAALIVARGRVTDLAALDLNRGDVLVLFGLTFWALYTVLIRWRPTRLPLTLFLAATIGLGALFHLPLLAWEIPREGGFAPTPATLGALAFFAVFPSVLAYVCWNKAVTALGPGRTGMFMYLMPVFSAGLGVGLLGEAFRPYHAAGIVLIFAGIALTTGLALRR